MKRKVKLTKYEWDTVITSLLRSERESITEPFQEMYRKTREKIENQLFQRKKISGGVAVAIVSRQNDGEDTQSATWKPSSP
jgi:hypothetical protein